MADIDYFIGARNRDASSPAFQYAKGGDVYKPEAWLAIPDFDDVAAIMNDFIDAQITYDPEGGAQMRFTIRRKMSGTEGMGLTMTAGYSPEFDAIFRGEITEVKDSFYGTSSQVLASGSAVVRGKQTLGEGLSFSGLTLRAAMDYINSNAHVVGEWGMEGGHEYVIHNPDDTQIPEEEQTNQPGYGDFMSEATWTEVERTLLEPTQYVAYDNPAGHVSHKKPVFRRGGTIENYKWWWSPNFTETSIPKDSFEFTPSTRNIYERVEVFRRLQEVPEGWQMYEDKGSGLPRRIREFMEVYASVDINRAGLWSAHPGTTYVVPDFNGTQAEAETECHRLAEEMAAVIGTFTFSAPLIIMWPNDVFYISKIEPMSHPNIANITGVPVPSGGPSHVRIVYACIADGTIQQEIGPQRFWMTVSGRAALMSMEAAANPADTSYRSTGLVPAAA